MEKNKVKVVFTDNGDGFHYHYSVESVTANPVEVHPQTLDRLLYEAFTAGAAAYSCELIVVGWGIARWAYTVDKEILRDLLKGAAAEAA